MEEIMKMLGPLPVLQFMFGCAILGGGVWMIVQGIRKKEDIPRLENQRLEWKAYDQLENIEVNSFKQVELMSKIYDRLNADADVMKGLAAAIWNNRERP